VFVEVNNAIYHEKYNEIMVWNDIGLFNLTKPVELSKDFMLRRMPVQICANFRLICERDSPSEIKRRHQIIRTFQHDGVRLRADR
jgi:hypothetical protein